MIKRKLRDKVGNSYKLTNAWESLNGLIISLEERNLYFHLQKGLFVRDFNSAQIFKIQTFFCNL